MDELKGIRQQKNDFRDLTIPEEIIDQGFRATFEYFEKKIPKENIAKPMRALRENSDPEDVSSQAEVNALAGYFMEPIWADTKKWIASHPNTLGELGPWPKMDLVSDEELRAAFDTNVNTGITLLSERSRDVISFIAIGFEMSQVEKIKKLQTMKTLPPSIPFQTQAFIRYTTLLQSPFYKAITSGSGLPYFHLIGGFQTAERITWATLHALPGLFQDKYGRAPNPEESEKLIASGKEFVLNLAQTEFSMLQHTEDYLEEAVTVKQGNMRSEGFHVFNHLYLREENGKYRIEIEKETLRYIADGILRTFQNSNFPKGRAVRTGCPAVVARGEGGNSVAVELYDWFAELAEKYYFPKVTESSSRT